MTLSNTNLLISACFQFQKTNRVPNHKTNCSQANYVIPVVVFSQSMQNWSNTGWIHTTQLTCSVHREGTRKYVLYVVQQGKDVVGVVILYAWGTLEFLTDDRTLQSSLYLQHMLHFPIICNHVFLALIIMLLPCTDTVKLEFKTLATLIGDWKANTVILIDFFLFFLINRLFVWTLNWKLTVKIMTCSVYPWVMSPNGLLFSNQNKLL